MKQIFLSLEPPIPHIFAHIRTKTGPRANRESFKEKKIVGILHGDPEKIGKPDLLIYVCKKRLNELSKIGALGDNQKFWLVRNPFFSQSSFFIETKK